MEKILRILKSNGELEPFSPDKLRNSLRRAGASEERASEIIAEIESKMFDGVSTRVIFNKAFELLRKPLSKTNILYNQKNEGAAARYKLKNAMMELGPTGHPFETLVGEVFRKLGFDVEVAKILQGSCVTHEMDVIATKGVNQMLIECKFHNSQNINAGVQVPLYVRSRVNDIVSFREKLPEFKGFAFTGAVVTNTRFSDDAISYGECSGLKLLSWDYPAGQGLREIIDREKIFPVTVLTRLTLQEKQLLMEHGYVTCEQLHNDLKVLGILNLEKTKLKRVIDEINSLSL